MHNPLIEFTVEGSGPFPRDMLRYDRAVPAKYEDFTAITRAWTDPSLVRANYRVALRAELGPTEARWESFGWRVVA